jgi:hypothetical protein
MDIRKLSIEERNCPYQMAKHFITQNENDYYDKIKFLNKSYSISELKNIVDLCKLFNRDEKYISKILKVSRVREVEDVELLINNAVNDLEIKLKTDKKNYYIDELKNNSKRFDESNFEKFNLTFLKEMETEFIELRSELKEKNNSSLFFDNINKMISCIQLSSVHIIKHQKSLTPNMLMDRSVFTGFLINNSILKTITLENENIQKEKLEVKNKKKHNRKMKLKMN